MDELVRIRVDRGQLERDLGLFIKCAIDTQLIQFLEMVMFSDAGKAERHRKKRASQEKYLLTQPKLQPDQKASKQRVIKCRE
jgi:hypothetical protein